MAWNAARILAALPVHDARDALGNFAHIIFPSNA